MENSLEELDHLERVDFEVVLQADERVGLVLRLCVRRKLEEANDYFGYLVSVAELLLNLAFDFRNVTVFLSVPAFQDGGEEAQRLVGELEEVLEVVC